MINQEKTYLRENIRLQKFAVSSDLQKQFEIFSKLKLIPFLKEQPLKKIGGYLASPHEFEISDFITELPLVFPRVLSFKSKKMAFFVLQKEELLRSGLRQPAKGSKTVKNDDLSAFLIPGLAFDKQGNRLGTGYGFYDRFLRGFPGSVLKIGICPDQFLLEKIPNGKNDVKMDLIFTEKKLHLLNFIAGNTKKH